MILAVDPGGTSGYVVLHPDGRLEAWGEERDQLAFASSAWELLIDGWLTDVVCERWFNVTGRPMSFQPAALEIIGTLRWQAYYSHTDFHLQSAGDAKAYGTPERLAPYRAQGCGKGGGGHALMALSHALLFLGTRKAVTHD